MRGEGWGVAIGALCGAGLIAIVGWAFNYEPPDENHALARKCEAIGCSCAWWAP